MKKLVRKNILRSIIKKEFKQLFRDKRVRIMLFGSPIIMLVLFGYAVNMDVNNVKLAVLDEDRTAMSRSVVEAFVSSGYFTLSRYLSSGKEIYPLMDAGEIELFIQIEKGFSKDIRSDRSASIQIITDGSDSNRASVIISYVNEIINRFSLAKLEKRIMTRLVAGKLSSAVEGRSQLQTAPSVRMKKNIELKERIFFNPELKSRDFFLPGIISILISLITVTLTSMSIVKEREVGTIEQLLVSPIEAVELVLGKTVPFAIIGFVDIFIITLIAVFWFGVPFKGSFIFLLLSGFMFILTTLAIGLYISTISKTQQQAMLSTFLFMLPSILLSGFIFPIYSMPETIQVVTFLNPQRYFIEIIRSVFLKGAGIKVPWKEVGALAVSGVFLFYLSARRFRRRLE